MGEYARHLSSSSPFSPIVPKSKYRPSVKKKFTKKSKSSSAAVTILSVGSSSPEHPNEFDSNGSIASSYIGNGGGGSDPLGDGGGGGKSSYSPSTISGMSWASNNSHNKGIIL